MPSLVTLGTLRTKARQRADMENSKFISDSEFNGIINDSAKELYDLLTTTYEDYYWTTSSISVVGGTDTYSLPDDFYKLLGVDEILNQSTGQSISLKPFMFAERNAYTQPQVSYPVKLHYIPTMTEMVEDTDTFDGINGYEEYIIIDAAMKALIKEESDASALMAQKQAMIKRIQGAAPNRDAGRGQRVTDIYNIDPFDYLQIPSRLRYHIVGNSIIFKQQYNYGAVND